MHLIFFFFHRNCLSHLECDVLFLFQFCRVFFVKLSGIAPSPVLFVSRVVFLFIMAVLM